jgi:hypothetical protein
MDGSPDRALWEQFARPGFRVRFSYPTVTSGGESWRGMVEARREERR